MPVSEAECDQNMQALCTVDELILAQIVLFYVEIMHHHYLFSS